MLTTAQDEAIRRVEEARAAYYQDRPVRVEWPHIPAVAK